MEGKDLILAEADKMQGYIVAKDNQFIKHSLYDLSLTEQRILACAISTVDSQKQLNENEIPKCEMGVNVFCELCGIERRGAVKYLKAVLKKLRDRSFWIQKEDGSCQLFSWVSDASIDDVKDTIVVWLSLAVKPYLLNLGSEFTTYKLPMILRFKNKYSNMIFDLIYSDFKRNGYIYGEQRRYKAGTLQISVDDMKRRVLIRKDQNGEPLNRKIRFVDLKLRILEPAVEEINEFTDIMVKIEYGMCGKKAETILFHYRPKSESEFAKVPLFRGKRIERI